MPGCWLKPCATRCAFLLSVRLEFGPENDTATDDLGTSWMRFRIGSPTSYRPRWRDVTRLRRVRSLRALLESLTGTGHFAQDPGFQRRGFFRWLF
jgi:hypothetical protein